MGPAGFGDFDGGVEPGAVMGRAADAVGIFPEDGSGFWDEKEEVGLVVVDGGLDL